MVAKSNRDIRRLHEASRATACLLKELVAMAQPGTTTRALDEYAAHYIRHLGGEPVFRTQNGFPGCINTSINDEAVHGVPSRRILVDGDLLKIDCGIRLRGYCGDATVTVGVGDPGRLDKQRRSLMETAHGALNSGIEATRVGGNVGDIGHAMQAYVEGSGYTLLRQYTGHGLGTRLWEAPSIPAHGQQGTGPRIVDGLVFTIEPILVAGSPRTYVAADGWTVRTVDGAPAAQFEHTVMATRSGPIVLSRCA